MQVWSQQQWCCAPWHQICSVKGLPPPSRMQQTQSWTWDFKASKSDYWSCLNYYKQTSVCATINLNDSLLSALPFIHTVDVRPASLWGVRLLGWSLFFYMFMQCSMDLKIIICTSFHVFPRQQDSLSWNLCCFFSSHQIMFWKVNFTKWSQIILYFLFVNMVSLWQKKSHQASWFGSTIPTCRSFMGDASV